MFAEVESSSGSMFWFWGYLIVLVPAIFFLLTLQKTLQLTGDKHRTLNPPLVWLELIPFFGFIWQFVVIINIAKSVVSWAQERQAQVDDGGRKLGMIACILSCCSIIPFLGMLAGLASLVCWILYWIKMAGFNKLMAQPAPEKPAM